MLFLPLIEFVVLTSLFIALLKIYTETSERVKEVVFFFLVVNCCFLLFLALLTYQILFNSDISTQLLITKAFTSILTAVYLGYIFNTARRFSQTLFLLDKILLVWNCHVVGQMLFRVNPTADDLTLLDLNHAAQEITSNIIKPGELLCQKLPNHESIVPEYNKRLIDIYLDCLESQEEKRLEFQYKGKVMGWFINYCVPISKNYLYMNFIDVTEIKQAAYTDYLSGLYNRRYLFESGYRYQACIYFDLDGFKGLNDRHGHSAGDQYIRQLASQLKEVVDSISAIALRVGGDEFILMFLDAACIDQYRAVEVAREIDNIIRQIKINQSSITASFGISMNAAKDKTIDTLITEAEKSAMLAKSTLDVSEPKIIVWSQKVSKKYQRSAQVEKALHRTDWDSEFLIYYQDIFDIKHSCVIGAEALLRWRSPELGMVSPNEFIPLAESNGLIYNIGQWVVRRVLEDAATLAERGDVFLLSFNLSPIELESENFIFYITNCLNSLTTRKVKLGVEITERGFAMNQQVFFNNLLALKEMNFILKVDDFGTGYSNLLQLLQFPFDEIKIDKGIVPIDRQDTSRIAITQSIVALGEQLNFKTVAEGIETQEQYDLVKEIGVDYAQGFFLGRPRPL